MPIGDCWATGSWVDGAWGVGTWADTQVCAAAPIGSVWASGSWSATAWCSGTWAGGTPPATGGGTLPRYARRVVVPLPVDDWQARIRRKREEEEIVIL